MEPFLGLLRQTCCPHCWKVFAPEEVLWISVHPDLIGDPLLGRQQMRRFLPSRFTVEGNAIDPKGAVCRDLACPSCNLQIPRAILEMEPLYVSVIGAPGSGKSFFLTAMTWNLRKLLPRFELEFRDADLVLNRTLTSYEESLFLPHRPNEPVLMTDLIRKTEKEGDQYDLVRYGNQTVLYPRPFLFSIQPMRDHLKAAAGKRLARTLCIYDNAGESFAVGTDGPTNPVTQHLARSHLLLFLFDPTQDPRFSHLAGQATRAHTLGRQDIFLTEAINRIRLLTGMPLTQRSKRPLIVVATKFDAWGAGLAKTFSNDPWREKKGQTGLDIQQFQTGSETIRQLLKQTVPEIVGAAESFSEQVAYWPVSALGCMPRPDPHTGKAMICPGDIRPMAVTTPIIYGLFLSTLGLVTFIRKTKVL